MNPTQPSPAHNTEAVQPKVSVLIPSFNSIGALRRCLAALEASEGRGEMEILVLDGGSKDGTSAIDVDFPEVTLMRQPRYFGATKLRNIGTRTAKGTYILFLSPAIEVRPETVRLLAQALDEHAEWGAVAPLVANAGQVLPLPTPQNLSEGAAGNWQQRPVEPGSGPAEVDNPSFKALMARRASIAGMHYFDERFGEAWSDIDYCYKLRKAGKKLVVLRDAPVVENTEGLWLPRPSVATAFAADRAVGAAQFAGKHFSGMIGAQLKAGTLFRALGSGQLGAFSRIIGGQKVDGSEVIN